jgi:DNA topoisomerase IA
MTPQAIRDGFDSLRSDKQMQGLADAARSRSEADWLVGINGTRAMTAFNSRDGGFFLTTVGRVQTPTLAVVVEREEQIRKFISRDYWEIHATFLAEAGEYPPSGSTRSGRRTRTTPRSGPTASGPTAKRRPSPMPCAARPPRSPRRASPPRRPRRRCLT